MFTAIANHSGMCITLFRAGIRRRGRTHGTAKFFAGNATTNGTGESFESVALAALLGAGDWAERAPRIYLRLSHVCEEHDERDLARVDTTEICDR